MLQQNPPQTSPAAVRQTFQAARQQAIQSWSEVLPRLLPFADAATVELPMSRLLRLSLFQVSVGMAGALLTGTLNRVMIVELGVAAWLVARLVVSNGWLLDLGG